ncbi:SDR family NAD(P)-dependent oxidoreductase [Actomonas aquatica]|uniref:SDR family NAD(P)-dependent oxidoreductase n=1 Tax=Actomonas aquatica TaxID=2866162 RepID=A0ABZ1C4S2_9BACT|nr:SDR family NAD(P)-dependent oxidoreductase [Opitutus sp. WL0086]WRQ86243.1 SDR family NAD(P)-dependent oxidoreductase [Opitutus sp. WL0086]
MSRIALVTGANRGIGLAITRGLAAAGFKVWLGSRQLAAGEAAAAELHREGLSAVTAVALDVGDPASIAAALATIEAAGDTIDVLVNNAGVLYGGALLELDDAQVDQSIAVHLTGPLRLVRALAPGMIARDYGRIVNLSSGWGAFSEDLGGPDIYGVTKAALNALTLRLSRELPGNVKINAMCPGWVRTRMGGDEATLSPEQAADTALWLAQLPADGPTGGFFRARKPLQW